jgi:hypothetical protein
MWYEHYHITSLRNTVPITDYSEMIGWLDENIGWAITENNRFLPYYGHGWRIDIDRSGDERVSGICLTIDDDTAALMYKLAYGDKCDNKK